MDFLKTITGLKKNPLEMKNALDHVANYDKERNKNDFYTSTLLRENEHPFLYVKHVEIKEIISSIMGFDYDKYKFLHSIANIRRLGDEIIKSTEKSIKDIPEELSESVREELKQSMELQIEKYRTPLTLYESGAQTICDDVDHILELFRRTYVSGDVAICGEWSGLDTLVDARVFLMWARENGFYIPEEVSCLLEDPTATTTTTEPGHDQQVDAPDHNFKTIKDHVKYLLKENPSKGLAMRKIHSHWKLKKYEAAAYVLDRPAPDDEEERRRLNEQWRYHTGLLDQNE